MGSGQHSYPAGGWYSDPTGRAAYRFWSGDHWTRWISDGTTVAADLRPVRRTLGRDDLTHLGFVEDVFLAEARADGIVTAEVDQRLTDLRRRLTAEALHETVPATMAPTGAPAPDVQPPRVPPGVAPRPEGAVVPPVLRPAPAVREPVPHEPSLLARVLASAREALATDLATNGLAYLGVLLVFVGSFGLVVFAFGSVSPWLRPVAEVVIATVPFATGAMLRRRGATVAGRALEVGGGLLLPVMVVTTFLDGFAVPPDPTGVPLVLALTVCCALVALGYAVWCRKHPESGLRFVVAPAVWMTVAMASLGVGRAIPSGNGVSVPGAAQLVLVSAALVVTLALAMVRPRWALSPPTLTSGVVGWAVVGLLSVLAWGAEDWPALPVAATGALLLVALELLRGRLGASVVGAVEPVWVAGVGLALVAGLGLAEAAAVTAAVLVLVVERAAERRAPAWAVGLPAALAGIALLCTFVDPWWAVGAFAVATAWALARRLRPYAVPGARVALDVTAAVLPVGVVAAVAAATDVATATAVGAGLVLLATVPATWPVFRRDPQDAALWRYWWWVAATAVALVAVPGSVGAETTSQRWWMVSALVVLVVSLVRGPVPWVGRVWALTFLAAWTWWSAALLLDVPDVVRAGVLGLAALGLVLVAHLGRPRMLPDDRFSTGGAGHALAVCALLPAGTGWGPVLVLGLATAGFAVSAAFDAVDRSPVVDGVVAAVGRGGRFVAPALAALGLPLTVVTALDTSGRLAVDDAWMTAVPALTAVVYAASTRLVKVAPARLTLGWTAFGLAVLAALVAPTYLPPTDLPTAVGCASVIVAVLLLPNTDRVAPMTWTAWVALAPLTFSLLSAGFDRFDRLDPTRAWSSVLVGVGGAMLLIGTAVDLRDRGWVTRLLPARPLLLPVMVVGAAEVVLSQALALTEPRDPGGWLMVAGAVVVLGVALLLRVGSLSCVALVLGWFGAVRLSFERVETSPWIAVTVATALLVVAEILHRALADRTWWSRWDLPVLVSAAPVATTALWAAADGDGFSWTYFSVGLMCAVVAGRLYRTVEASASLAGVGTVLMFTGTANAGPGWVALLLLAYAVGCTAAAMVAAAPWKYVLQLGGAVLALASWLAALAWLDWSDQRSFDVTVAVAGAVTLLAAGVALSRRLHPSWVWAWGGTATAVTGSAVVAVADAASGLDTSITVVLSWYAVAGLAAVAVATAIAAEPLASGWLRELAVAFGLVSLLTAFDVVDATSTAGVAVLGAVSVVLGIAALTPFCSEARPAARRAVLELGAATAVLAVGFSWDELPDRDLLVASLAVAAVQAASAGIALRSVALQSCAPVLACASWVVFASQAVNADAQWFTVPIGAALLAVVTLWRRDRRSRSAPVASPEIVAVELVGIAFLVGSSFVQTFTTSVGYAALAAVIGLLLVGWGLVTRVRRRLLAGALVTVGGVVLLVMVPLVRLLPAWQGAWMWILVVVVGLLALGAASLLESGRSMVRTGRRRFVDLTGGWE